MPLSPEEGARAPHVVMDPLAALRRCLQYVCSHPEVYGDDVRGLLDREVMHVVRLKASEVSLANGERPLLVDSLESTGVRQAARALTGVPPLNTIPAQSTASNGAVPDSVSAGDLFGYGSVSFLPAFSVGFSALLQDSRADWPRADQAGGSRYSDERKTFCGRFPSTSSFPAAPQLSQDECIQWNDTLPPSCASANPRGIRTIGLESVRNDEAVKSSVFSEDMDMDGGGTHSDKTRQASPSLSPGATFEAHGRFNPQDQSPALGLHEGTPNSLSAAPPSAVCRADGTVLLVDQQGYEVTYLRTQLQQLEAAFNSKCVRLHELEVENRQFAEKMKASEEARARWAAQHHAMKGQVEVMRRELDGWKDRANDAVTAATKKSKQQNQRAKQIVYSQLSDAKQEIVRLGQLWRETERALQETRRAFENTEKEAVAAHNHLTDVFHYLERLERRIARRDVYVSLCERRQRSLEEKYEKLRWGYEELSTLDGRYSYVDYMLTTRPLWSVYLFVRLARHQGEYVALENPMEVQQRLLLMAGQAEKGREVSPEAAAATLAAMEPLYGLIFSRSPQGGRLVAQEYDFRLVFRTMVAETTADLSRRGRPKQVRTTLHGSVACRVIRWHERYSIDYLRGQDDDPESAELHRKCVPLLTLASVLLPLRSRAGAILMRPTPVEAAASSANVADSTAPEQAAGAEEERVHTLLSTTSNKRHYDEATIRFVLRCFWKERLSSFSQQMNARVSAVNEKRARKRELEGTLQNGKTEKRISPTGECLPPVSESSARSDESDDDEDDVAVNQTFLAALVDFSTRFAVQQASSGIAAPTKSGVPPSKATLVNVRGVLTRGASDTKLGGRSATSISYPDSKAALDSMWDSGRIFFAVVLQPGRSAATKQEATSPTSDAPTPEEVSILAEEAREMLAALYYYTLEYKDLDPDFRLFYLVAHQMIPEMVAVNFFAGLEAFQLESVALLEWRLQCLSAGMHIGATRTAAGQPPSSPTMPKEVEDPLMALTRAVDVIDDALLDGEEEDIETDSDGDGYGSILPFRASAQTQVHPSTASSATTGQRQEGRREDSSTAETQSPVRPVSRRTCELQLLHNIRAYLRERRGLMQGEQGVECVDGDAELGENAENPTRARLAAFSFGEAPPEWTALEERVLNILGPHTALLDTFRHQYRKRKGEDAVQTKGKPMRPGKELDHLRRRRSERNRRHERAKYLSATRGLLTAEDVLALVQRHCLATYAVSCCGTPRFSLLGSLFGRSSDRGCDASSGLDPYAIVGHLPLTGLHLQRLRFALSLDQPSHLIRTSALFSVDPVTKSNSHFYDAYLTIVLDVFEQQQSFLMHSVLCSCAARHELYAAEGAEDCDGLIPIACLKKGLTAAFSTISGTSQHALAVLNHLVQYDELLRLEDEVRFEQFTDAPLLLNVPPRHGRGCFTADGDGSVEQGPGDVIDEGKWNLREEADSCSLLNIAFALRMSYIVWGEVSAGTAEALVHRIVKRAVPVCCSDAVQGDAVWAVSAVAVNKDATVVEEFTEWDIFDQTTRQQYARALMRLQKGHNGDANPLRRTLSALQTELLRPASILSSRARVGASMSLSPGAVDVDALYPDVAGVWTTTKVLAEIQKHMERAAAAVPAKGTGASGKGRKKRNLSQPHKSLFSVQAAGKGNDSADEEEQVPDYGLLSLVRALGFAPPLLTSVPGVGGAAANKKGGGRKSTTKRGASKSRAGPETAIPACLQQEYSEKLSMQLQDLAARVAALTPSDLNRFPEDMSVAGDVSVNMEGATPSANSLSVSNRSVDAPTPESSPSRVHSVSLARKSLQSTSQSKLHKKVIVETPVDTKRNSLEPHALAPAWVPLFPGSTSALDNVGAPLSSSMPMDVSKLYAICAALSMT
ncbi:conserved hypothetical protein [Leishmania major strain Friedlin]|uniref:Uncharacterized protein n=1 Tax=Leishmania major TaxID=5664 RepID=Q4Q2Z3_LEIMA|nr:conserved hypothetical protein [Leishmania major strain Friedlin]CAG9582079.1 hypothetical_protein_-_conserved [Leishmania major strain Friedlin]CAJ07920.1 conserved hypothetical protein [Leishmania major strain Friedlin]|eukprot:XP_001686305.1 conserved hypothetical protein [Leishmania major strain Friedlin]